MIKQCYTVSSMRTPALNINEKLAAHIFVRGYTSMMPSARSIFNLESYEKLSVWGALPQDWGAFRPAGAFFSKSAPKNAHFAYGMGLCAGWRPKVWDKGARLPDGRVVCDRFESLGRPTLPQDWGAFRPAICITVCTHISNFHIF